MTLFRMITLCENSTGLSTVNHPEKQVSSKNRTRIFSVQIYIVTQTKTWFKKRQVTSHTFLYYIPRRAHFIISYRYAMHVYITFLVLIILSVFLWSIVMQSNIFSLTQTSRATDYDGWGPRRTQVHIFLFFSNSSLFPTFFFFIDIFFLILMRNMNKETYPKSYKSKSVHQGNVGRVT